MLGMRPVLLCYVMRENTKWSIEVRVRVFYPCYIPDNLTGVGDNGKLSGSFVSGSVVNLSKKVLSEADINLLSKGLKFSPTPTDINKAELKEDLDVFKRRIRLKW